MGPAVTDMLNEEVIRQHVKTQELGQKIHFYPSIDSTNTMAKELAEKGETHGALVIAETQTRGRGRLGRTWYSPVGGLWFSLVLRPRIPQFQAPHMTFIAGLSIAQAAQKAGVPVSLRWPNDIYIQDKKAGGILTEARLSGGRFEYLVIGIGLNVNVTESAFPGQLKEEATSFLMAKGEPISRPLFLGHTLLAWEKLLQIYPRQGFAPILKAWKKYAAFLGSQVRVDTSSESVEGEAIDVTFSGALRVQDVDGLIHEVSSGDVRKLW